MSSKFLFVISFLLIPFVSISQLANLTTQEPQRSSFKTLGRGLNLNADYAEDNILYNQFHEVIELEDGFYKVGVNNNSRIHKRKNLSIHIIRMDKSLKIIKEFEVELQTKQNNNYVIPFALYKNGDKIELLANNKADGQLNIINWEFSLTDFSIISQDKIIGSFSISNNSYCDFLYDINEKSGFGGISFIERKGKKSKECAIHSLSWNNNQQKVFQYSTDLAIAYQSDILSKLRTSPTGTIWTLLDSREKSISIGSTIFYMAENKGKLTEVLNGTRPVVGASFSLDKTNKGIFVSGFIPSSNAINERLYVGYLDTNGKLMVKNELAFTESFLEKTTKLDKLPKGSVGLSKNYFVREILLRENDIVDVIASYIYIDVRPSTDGLYTKYIIGDIHVHSFSGDKLVSSICINRNIEDKQGGSYYNLVTMKEYTIPFVYSVNNNLMMLSIVNTNNSVSKNNSDLKEDYLGKSQFVALKIDQEQKITKQIILDPEDKVKGFGIFTGIILRKITNGQFFAYGETKRSVK